MLLLIPIAIILTLLIKSVAIGINSNIRSIYRTRNKFSKG
jgi:hypothetical protein